ncbi:hypothetical protein Angca_008657, partial [Angiostrongylus cantonensis]
MRFALFTSLFVTVVYGHLCDSSHKFNTTTNDSVAEDSSPLRHRRSDDEGSGDNPQCKPLGTCYSNDDCFGGQCIGAFVGKCNCNGCLDLLRCENDTMCGGLKGACNLNTTTCDCTAGYSNAGFSSLADALLHFCNVKNCTKQTEDKDCFGLQCTSGLCLCL